MVVVLVVLVAVGVAGAGAGIGAGRRGAGGGVVTAVADAQLLAQLAQHVQSSASRANCVLPLAAR